MLSECERHMETYSLILGFLGLMLFYGALFFNGVLNGFEFTLAFFSGVGITLLAYELATEMRARWVLYRVGLVAAVLWGANVASSSAASYFGTAGSPSARLQSAAEICASDVDARAGRCV